MATKTKTGGDGLALPPVRTNRTHRAAEIAAVLQANAEAYHRREIGHERFSEVGYAAWADAEREGVADLVMKAVRRA